MKIIVTLDGHRDDTSVPVLLSATADQIEIETGRTTVSVDASELRNALDHLAPTKPQHGLVRQEP